MKDLLLGIAIGWISFSEKGKQISNDLIEHVRNTYMLPTKKTEEKKEGKEND